MPDQGPHTRSENMLTMMAGLRNSMVTDPLGTPTEASNSAASALFSHARPRDAPVLVALDSEPLAGIHLVEPGTGTLQAALDQAAAGDELVLANGNYTAGGGDQVVSINQTITIRALNPGQAVLNALGARRVVTINGGTVLLEGLNITGGRAGNGYGGGICVCAPNGAGCTNPQVTISSCSIYSNTASYGGGIAVEFGNFKHNNVTILGSNIFENSASAGGGFRNYDGNVTVRASNIYSNSAGTGGGIFNLYGIVAIRGSDIYQNIAQGNGGGIFEAYRPDQPTSPTIDLGTSSSVHDNNPDDCSGLNATTCGPATFVCDVVNHTCYQDPLGDFLSLANCSAACELPKKYSCHVTTKMCIEDPSGVFPALAECAAKCI